MTKKNVSLIVPDIPAFAYFPFGYLKEPLDKKQVSTLDISGTLEQNNRKFEYRWVVSGDPDMGLPVGNENDFEAFLHIEYAISGRNGRINCTRNTIIERLRYSSSGGRVYEIINNAIAKFRSIEVNAINCLLDPAKNKLHRIINFPFFDSVEVSVRQKQSDLEIYQKNASPKEILRVMLSHRDAEIEFRLSSRLQEFIGAYNNVPLDWDLYTSLPDIKSRTLFRTINKLRYYGIDSIPLLEIGKLLSLTRNEGWRVKNSIAKPLEHLKKVGEIHNYEIIDNKLLRFHFNPVRIHRKSTKQKDKPVGENKKLYDYLVKKCGVYPSAARDILNNNIYWHNEDMWHVVRYYRTHAARRKWNAGMLVLLLKGDTARCGEYIDELNDYIKSIKTQTNMSEPVKAEEPSLDIKEIIDEYTEKELGELMSAYIQNTSEFMKERLKEAWKQYNGWKKAALRSPVVRSAVFEVAIPANQPNQTNQT
jgi:hypothetical protein